MEDACHSVLPAASLEMEWHARIVRLSFLTVLPAITHTVCPAQTGNSPTDNAYHAHLDTILRTADVWHVPLHVQYVQALPVALHARLVSTCRLTTVWAYAQIIKYRMAPSAMYVWIIVQSAILSHHYAVFVWQACTCSKANVWVHVHRGT